MSEFAWSLILAIPLAILANIFSIPILKWFEKRSKTAGDKRATRDAEFAAQAAGFAADRPSFYSYLLEAVLRTTFVGALTGILAGAFAIAGSGLNLNIQGSNGLYKLAPIAYAATSLVSLVGAVIVLNITRTALIMVRKVRELKR